MGRGRGGGLVVSMFDFYSDNPSSKTAVKFVFEKNVNKNKKRPGWPVKNTYVNEIHEYVIYTFRIVINNLVYFTRQC